MSRRRYLVAWDIANPRRLRATRRCAEDFGDPLQKSVFLCDLNKEERERMMMRFKKIMNRNQDQVVVLDLGPTERNPDSYLESLGLPASLPERISVV